MQIQQENINDCGISKNITWIQKQNEILCEIKFQCDKDNACTHRYIFDHYILNKLCKHYQISYNKIEIQKFICSMNVDIFDTFHTNRIKIKSLNISLCAQNTMDKQKKFSYSLSKAILAFQIFKIIQQQKQIDYYLNQQIIQVIINFEPLIIDAKAKYQILSLFDESQQFLYEFNKAQHMKYFGKDVQFYHFNCSMRNIFEILMSNNQTLLVQGKQGKSKSTSLRLFYLLYLHYTSIRLYFNEYLEFRHLFRDITINKVFIYLSVDSNFSQDGCIDAIKRQLFDDKKFVSQGYLDQWLTILNTQSKQHKFQAIFIVDEAQILSQIAEKIKIMQENDLWQQCKPWNQRHKSIYGLIQSIQSFKFCIIFCSRLNYRYNLWDYVYSNEKKLFENPIKTENIDKQILNSRVCKVQIIEMIKFECQRKMIELSCNKQQIEQIKKWFQVVLTSQFVQKILSYENQLREVTYLRVRQYFQKKVEQFFIDLQVDFNLQVNYNGIINSFQKNLKKIVDFSIQNAIIRYKQFLNQGVVVDTIKKHRLFEIIRGKAAKNSQEQNQLSYFQCYISKNQRNFSKFINRQLFIIDQQTQRVTILFNKKVFYLITSYTNKHTDIYHQTTSILIKQFQYNQGLLGQMFDACCSKLLTRYFLTLKVQERQYNIRFSGELYFQHFYEDDKQQINLQNKIFEFQMIYQMLKKNQQRNYYLGACPKNKQNNNKLQNVHCTNSKCIDTMLIKRIKKKGQYIIELICFDFSVLLFESGLKRKCNKAINFFQSILSRLQTDYHQRVQIQHIFVLTEKMAEAFKHYKFNSKRFSLKAVSMNKFQMQFQEQLTLNDQVLFDCFTKIIERYNK